MIVKNEAAVIRRCLDSVRPIIDHWVIVDTGSTDGTQAIIREHLRDLPGELYERPWRDFAHNRSEALELARDKGAYTLIIDADDTLEIARSTGRPALTADCYTLTIADAGIAYQRAQLVRSALPWRYEGVLHEYLTCEGPGPSELLSGIEMRRNHDGARRKDPQTYQRYAAVLEAALRTETRPFLRARYCFYLAQRYRDCREPQAALKHYLARAELGFWQEEVFISLYQAAQLMEQLHHPDQDVIEAYLRASDARPTRVEALYRASLFCRQKKRYEEGYHLAKRGLAVPMPPDALFVEPRVYEFGLLDEFALNAYWSGRNQESLDASLKILATVKLSAADMQRVIANARFASERLPQDPDLGSLGSESFAVQHVLAPPRALRSRLPDPPRVLVTIVAGQKKASLPLCLACIEALDYPKSAIVLCLRVAHGSRTEGLLREWVSRVGDLYAGVDLEAEDLEGRVEQIGTHAGNATGPRAPGHLRDMSLRRALELACDFCFVVDVDSFVRPCTLRELVALGLPIVAPFLRSIDPSDPYSNYHAEIDANGYYQGCDQYAWVLNRLVRGVLEMPVVKPPYLVRADVLNELAYEDGSARHEYVIFSASARERGIPQYLDNRQVYGYVVRAEGDDADVADNLARAKQLLGVPGQTWSPSEQSRLAEQPKPIARTPRSTWIPDAPAAGTEIMVGGLKQRLGSALDRIDLKINHPGPARDDTRPRVVWIHHDINQDYMQWCKDKALVDTVGCFVFVSHWQRERYLAAFGLPRERCVVLQNATDVSPDLRSWDAGPISRCAYTSTPFRGLSVLLDAWERLGPSGAELNIWSSMKLYREDDGPYAHLYERAQSMPGVIYHGIVPNAELRAALRTIHFLTYPSTFAETSCLAVIEAMAAGCRVIVPSLGALPETTCGYAHLYAPGSDAAAHARSFSDALQREFARPWCGAPQTAFKQQQHCAAAYDWRRRVEEWRRLIDSVCDKSRTHAVAAE